MGLFKLNSTEQCLLGLLTVLSVLGSLFTGHNTRLMWGFRDHYWMRPRWTNLQIVLVGVWTQVYLLTRPVWSWEAFIRQGRDLDDLNDSERLLHSCVEVITAMALTGMSIGFCIRVWHQYYSAMVAVQIGVAEWRGMIDESLVKDKMGWFLRNRHTWGNRKFLDKLGAIVFASVGAIAITFEGVLTLGAFSYLLVITGCSLAIIAVFAYKYPSFKDKLYLRREKKNLVYLLGGGLLIWTSSSFIPRFMGLTWEKNRNTMAIFEWFRTSWSVLVMISSYYAVSQLVMLAFERPSLSLLSSKYCRVVCPSSFQSEISVWNLPLNFVINNANNSSLLKMKRLGSMSSASSSGSPRDGSKSGSGVYGNAALLKNTMEDNMRFRAFMAHLFREFSYENALCFIECLKFKQRMLYLIKKRDRGGSPSPPSVRPLTSNTSQSDGSNTNNHTPDSKDHPISDDENDDAKNDNEHAMDGDAPQVKRAITMADLVNSNSPRSASRFTFDSDPVNKQQSSPDINDVTAPSSKGSIATAIFGRKKSKKTRNYIESIKFCSDITESKSTLVSELSNLDDSRSVANKICQRYIREDAPYCVNLSFRQRFQLLELVESAVENESSIDSNIFDGVIIACTHLLKESMSRMNENYNI